MKIISRFFIFTFTVLFLSFAYLSLVGIETSSFNNQIQKNLKNIDTNLDIKLNTVKLKLDPISFKLNLKTVGPTIFYRDKGIELENIKSDLLFSTLISRKFSSSNLSISSKSVDLKKFVSFVRGIENRPDLYLLENFIRGGFIIIDMNLFFDEKGNLQNNFELNGSVRDGKLKFLKKNELKGINFLFSIKKDLISLVKIKASFDKMNLLSQKIQIKKEQNGFLVKGKISNQKIKLNSDYIEKYLFQFPENLILKDIIFKSENDFSFLINKKYKIKNLDLNSSINLSELTFDNKLDLKKYFPNLKNETSFNDHKIQVKYIDDKISISGKGDVQIQKENDVIEYKIIKQKNKTFFETILNLKNNELILDIINYKKSQKSNSKLEINGSYTKNSNLFFEKIKFSDQNDEISLNKLMLDKDFRISGFQNIKLNYVDLDKIKNQITIKKVKKNYEVKGNILNLRKLIRSFIKDDESNKTKIFKNNLNFSLNIKKVYLNDDSFLKNFIGELSLKGNEIYRANLIGSFSANEKLSFSVVSKDTEKISTFYSARAKPFIDHYDFIKGFEGGSLDFYSVNNGEKTNSKLKVYNFKLKELPALTKLLTLASLQGIADLLSGEGIRFSEFEMNLERMNNLINIDEIYAIGPAISILMEGYVEKNKLISLKGTLVPATTINKAIGSIPVIGDILVGKKTGEGVFGVSFKVKGPPKNLETTVNPIKTLTPRFITRTLEKIKKN